MRNILLGIMHFKITKFFTAIFRFYKNNPIFVTLAILNLIGYSRYDGALRLKPLPAGCILYYVCYFRNENV